MHVNSTVPLRVLIADDHGLMREAIADCLSRRGFNIVGKAESGPETIRLVQDLKPDVALVDISMPNMDGIETTRGIVRAAPNVRVIGFSLRDDPETVSRMKKAGAVAHISKGAPLHELVELIRRVGGHPCEQFVR